MILPVPDFRCLVRANLLWAMLTSAFSANPLNILTSRIPKLNARIEKMEPCPEHPNTPIRFENFIIDQVGFNKFALRGKIVITESLDRPLKMDMEMHRCNEKGDADSCEYYFTFKQRRVCDLLEKNDKSWQYFTNASDLPRTCPFPPNTYTVDGAAVDLQYLKSMPFFRSYWRIKSKAFMADKLMFCAVSELSLQMRSEQ